MRRKLFALIFVGFLAVILSVAVNAEPDGPKIIVPSQYSEHKIKYDVTIRWNPPDSKYGDVDYYKIAVRGFYPDDDVTASNVGSVIVDATTNNTKRSYTISGIRTSFYDYYKKYRISICAVMKDGTKRWSDYCYFYIASHNNPVDKPISFHIYNGFTSDSKNQVYYACRNWNNSLNIGREIVNTYPYSMGTDKIDRDANDGINIVTKKYSAEYYLMRTYKSTSTTTYMMTESDITVNSRYSWSNSTQTGKYNFYNSITHEIGHVVGLIDKYDSWSTEWTMYHSAKTGEDKGITLEYQDISNGRSLYK